MARSKAAQKALEWEPDPLKKFKVGVCWGTEIREFEISANDYRCCEDEISFSIDSKEGSKDIAEFRHFIYVIELDLSPNPSVNVKK